MFYTELKLLNQKHALPPHNSNNEQEKKGFIVISKVATNTFFMIYTEIKHQSPKHTP